MTDKNEEFWTWALGNGNRMKDKRREPFFRLGDQDILVGLEVIIKGRGPLSYDELALIGRKAHEEIRLLRRTAFTEKGSEE